MGGTVVQQDSVSIDILPARLNIQTLGLFRIFDSRFDSEIEFKSRKTLALLCCLSVTPGHALTRERAMELLWGSRGEEQARASLRQVLHDIRSSRVGEIGAIDIDRHHLAAREHAVRTDIDTLVRFAEIGSVAELEDTLSGCAERLFEGMDGIDPAFDDWLRVERERQLLRLNQAIVAACGSGVVERPSAWRTIFSSLQRLNPCDEAIARRGFELDHACGDLAALHQRYRWLEAALRRDLDVAPSDLTLDSFRRLTQAAPILRTPSCATTVPIVSPPTTPVGTTTPPAEPPILTLVPFDLSSRSGEEAVLAAVISDEIEFALSGLTDLRLLSTGHAMADLAAVSGTSLAAYALKGSLRVQGEILHLGWRLSRVRDGLVLWTHRATADPSDLNAALEQIVSRVAGAIVPTLERDIDIDDIYAGASDAEATSGYSTYVQARARIVAATCIADMNAAAELLERAIGLAPRLVNAHLTLARLYNTDFEQHLAGHDKAPLRRRAFDLCSRAVNLDPRSAHARGRLGWCYLRRGDFANARAQFEEALALSPYHADCLNEIGVAFGHMGDLDRAMALLTRAFEINPFPRDDYFCDIAVLQMLGGDHAKAEANFEIAHNEAFHYRAFRLANRGLMDDDMGKDLDRLRARFRAMWVRPDPPGDDDLLVSIFDHIPLQRQDHRDVVVRGLARLGLARGGG